VQVKRMAQAVDKLVEQARVRDQQVCQVLARVQQKHESPPRPGPANVAVVGQVDTLVLDISLVSATADSGGGGGGGDGGGSSGGGFTLTPNKDGGGGGSGDVAMQTLQKDLPGLWELLKECEEVKGALTWMRGLTEQCRQTQEATGAQLKDVDIKLRASNEAVLACVARLNAVDKQVKET
jgi:hypothetical protein